MSERSGATFREPFICAPEQYLVAESLLREARSFGAKVDDLRFVSHLQIKPRVTLLEEKEAGIDELRSEARRLVLEANGATTENINISAQLYKIGRKEFGRHQPLFWAVWKNSLNTTTASGQMEYLDNTPIAQKLIKLERTGRRWDKVTMWNLGNPELYLNENVPNFTRVLPDIPHFLFSDEIEKLKKGESAITHRYHELYEEEFEAYMVEKHPIYDRSIMYKIRASLVD